MTYIFKDKSMCCKAEVDTVGERGEGATLFWVCHKCKQPCNVYSEHSEEEKVSKYEDKLKEAIIKDFRQLYQFAFTTDYKARRIIMEMEVRVMGLENVLKLLSTATKKAYDKGYLVGLVDGHTDHKGCNKKGTK